MFGFHVNTLQVVLEKYGTQEVRWTKSIAFKDQTQDWLPERINVYLSQGTTVCIFWSFNSLSFYKWMDTRKTLVIM